MGAETSRIANDLFSIEQQTVNDGRSPASRNTSTPNVIVNSPNENRNTPPPKYYNIEDIANSDMDTMVDVTDKEPGSITMTPKIERKIAIVRHAETMNEAFPNWYSSCVSKEHYIAKDLNHPAKLPLRSRGLSLYNDDPPLTRLAKHASRIVGEALAQETDITWETVISAPELASVQTASAIAFSTTSDKTYVLIDESLCDPNHRKMDFMTPMELMKLDVSATVMASLKSKETGENSVTRVLNEIDKVQRTHKGNLIIVVGPTAFNAIVRKLLGDDSMTRKGSDIPQLASIILERGPRSWKLYKKQVLPLRNSGSASSTFDPTLYLSK